MLQFNLEVQNSRLDQIAEVIPEFAEVKSNFGRPPLIKRPTGFRTLLKTILEQQVSLASADSVYKKLLRGNPELTPTTFLAWTDKELLSFGYSRQKRRYTRLLSEAILEEKFHFTELEELPDEPARAYLMQLVGVGKWTADVYLLMAEGRADFFPAGDIALQKSWQERKKLEHKPGTQEMEDLANVFRPLRSAAAKWLWWSYLCKRDLPLSVDL
ncbi:MAG: DNA-3-methyladenine glycosylase 2 family protein [Saprospiraceae bacterium]|nr:DNA-3-methyladenine glycosylase 2 family protein [Saprospiraceae bacterium]